MVNFREDKERITDEYQVLNLPTPWIKPWDSLNSMQIEAFVQLPHLIFPFLENKRIEAPRGCYI